MAKRVVILDRDADIDHPSSDAPGWALRSFSAKHCNYAHPETLGLSLSIDPLTKLPHVTDRELAGQLRTGLAYFLSYYEHGSSLWFRYATTPPAGVEFTWDGVRVAGLLTWDGDEAAWLRTTLEQRAESADMFLRCYTSWANGDGLTYAIEDEDGTVLDACGGYYGCEEEYMLSGIVPQLIGHVFEVRGTASELETVLRRLLPAQRKKSARRSEADSR